MNRNLTIIILLLLAGLCAADSLNVRLVGHIDTPGSAEGVYVTSSFAYVADEVGGLRIIDVSTPSSPTEVGYFDTGDWAHGVYVSGSYAYVADGSNGLRIIDISTPASPSEIG
ncbi:hypothetical protein KAH81_10310 [bacterium]|nr:hypothetical protein [bacterium]